MTKRYSIDGEQLFYWVSVLAALVAVVMYLVAIDNKATAAVTSSATNEVQLSKVQATIDQDRKEFEEIRLRLAHIDDALNQH